MLIICKCAQENSRTYADTDLRDSICARVAQATSQTDIGSNSCEEMSHRVRPKAQTDFTVLAHWKAKKKSPAVLGSVCEGLGARLQRLGAGSFLAWVRP